MLQRCSHLKTRAAPNPPTLRLGDAPMMASLAADACCRYPCHPVFSLASTPSDRSADRGLRSPLCRDSASVNGGACRRHDLGNPSHCLHLSSSAAPLLSIRRPSPSVLGAYRHSCSHAPGLLASRLAEARGAHRARTACQKAHSRWAEAGHPSALDLLVAASIRRRLESLAHWHTTDQQHGHSDCCMHASHLAWPTKAARCCGQAWALADARLQHHRDMLRCLSNAHSSGLHSDGILRDCRAAFEPRAARCNRCQRRRSQLAPLLAQPRLRTSQQLRDDSSTRH